MPNLFGLDVASLIGEALRGQLVPGTLTKRAPGTRTPGSLTAGTNPSGTTHAFEGFLEERSMRRSGQLGAETMSVLTIIRVSISPAAVPEVNDRAVLEDPEFGAVEVDLVELLERDPAAALYRFRVE